MLVFYAFCCIVIVQEVRAPLRAELLVGLGRGGGALRVHLPRLDRRGLCGARARAYPLRHPAAAPGAARQGAGVHASPRSPTIAFACIALYWSLHTIRQLLQFDGQAPVLRVNKAWFEAAVPIGFALVIFRSLQGMWRDIGDLRAGREPFAGKAMFEE